VHFACQDLSRSQSRDFSFNTSDQNKRERESVYLDQGWTVRRGMIVPRRWARGWPRAPGRDGTASGGENPGLVAEQHLPDLLRTAADSFPPRISAGRSMLSRALARSRIDASIPPLPATLSRPRHAVSSLVLNFAYVCRLKFLQDHADHEYSNVFCYRITIPRLS